MSAACLTNACLTNACLKKINDSSLNRPQRIKLLQCDYGKGNEGCDWRRHRVYEEKMKIFCSKICCVLSWMEIATQMHGVRTTVCDNKEIFHSQPPAYSAEQVNETFILKAGYFSLEMICGEDTSLGHCLSA